MGLKELFRKSLDGDFGEDVKLNNVIRLIPMAEAEAADVAKCVSEDHDYFKAHPKDPDLLAFRKEGEEWKALADEGRAYLKSKGVLPYDERPIRFYCTTCGKDLNGMNVCPEGHIQHDIKGRTVPA